MTVSGEISNQVWSEPGSIFRVRNRGAWNQDVIDIFHKPSWYLKQRLVQVGKAGCTSRQRICRWTSGHCTLAQVSSSFPGPMRLNSFGSEPPLGVVAMDSVSRNLQGQDETPVVPSDLTASASLPAPRLPRLGDLWVCLWLVIIVNQTHHHLWEFFWLTLSRAWQHAHAIT